MGLFSRFLVVRSRKTWDLIVTHAGWLTAKAEDHHPKRETDMQSSGSGWGNGLLGVIIFSGSLPATRVAVGDFSALFLTSARAVIAALIGVVVLGLLRQARPQRKDL